MTFLLDTNIVSFAIKGDTRLQSYASVLQGSQQALSFMTVAELYQWAEIYGWGVKRRNELRRTLQNYIFLPLEVEMCPLWGRIRAETRREGVAMTAEDAWIATTAVYYGLPLVTHNPRDFTAVSQLQLITFA